MTTIDPEEPLADVLEQQRLVDETDEDDLPADDAEPPTESDPVDAWEQRQELPDEPE